MLRATGNKRQIDILRSWQPAIRKLPRLPKETASTSSSVCNDPFHPEFAFMTANFPEGSASPWATIVWSSLTVHGLQTHRTTSANISTICHLVAVAMMCRRRLFSSAWDVLFVAKTPAVVESCGADAIKIRYMYIHAIPSVVSFNTAALYMENDRRLDAAEIHIHRRREV